MLEGVLGVLMFDMGKGEVGCNKYIFKVQFSHIQISFNSFYLPFIAIDF